MKRSILVDYKVIDLYEGVMPLVMESMITYNYRKLICMKCFNRCDNINPLYIDNPRLVCQDCSVVYP